MPVFLPNRLPAALRCAALRRWGACCVTSRMPTLARPSTTRCVCSYGDCSERMIWKPGTTGWRCRVSGARQSGCVCRLIDARGEVVLAASKCNLVELGCDCLSDLSGARLS